MTKILEADEHGAVTIPAELLAETSPHAKYEVREIYGKLTLTPRRAHDRKRKKQGSQWTQEWRALVDQLAPTWKDNKSIVDTLSEMRR